MRKFRELPTTTKVALVGTGIALPVVGLGAANFVATRKAKVNVLKDIFNVDDVSTVYAFTIGQLLDTKMSVLSEQTEIRHILFELCTELTALYPSRLLCTAGRVNAVPDLLETVAMANEILKLCRDNSSDHLLQDIGDNVIEIIEDIFHDDDYLNPEFLKSNIRLMENILDEIETIIEEEADDFFEDEDKEAAEPEKGNCFDAFKTPASEEKKESHSEEVARKNAISDEEAFEQAKKIYKNMPEKFKSKKLDEKYGVESSPEEKPEEKIAEESVETTEAKKEEAKAIASEIAEKVVDAAEKTLELDNSNQKYPAKRASKSQKSPTEKKTVKRKTTTAKEEVENGEK